MIKHFDQYSKLLITKEFNYFLYQEDWKKLKNYFEFEKEFQEQLIKTYRINYKDIKYEEAKHRINKLQIECNNYYDNFTPLEIIAKSLDKILLYQNEEIIVNYNYYFDWLGHTNKISEDILLAVFCSYNYLDAKAIRNVSNAKHNNTILQSLFEEGLAENHLHLGAGANNFAFNYFSLVISEQKSYEWRYERIKKFTEILIKSDNLSDKSLKEEIIKELYYLIYLRKYLMNSFVDKEEILQNEEECLQNESKKYKFREFAQFSLDDDLFSEYESLCKQNPKTYEQYFIDDFTQKEVYLQFLNIEREFIVKLIDYYQVTENYQDKQIIFQYLNLKNRMHSYFINTKKQLGFKTFKSHNDIKKFFYKDDNTLNNCHINSIYLTNTKNNVEKLEYRTTLKGVKSTKNTMDMLIQYWNRDNVKIGNVIHFIKNSNYNKRYVSNLNKKAEVSMLQEIKNAIYIRPYSAASDSENSNFHLIGIDTASCEIGCGPEVYAQVFRSLTIGSKRARKRINLTYHVGEEYETLLSGLRSIDEVLEFYPMQFGDRLGHALALGNNVKQYYSRIECIYANRGIILDELIWLYYKLIEYSYEDSVFVNKLSEKIEQHLIKFKNMQNEVENWDELSINNIQISEYYYSMQLRSDSPINYKFSNILELEYKELFKQARVPNSIIHNEYNIQNKAYRLAFENRMAKYLNHLYHFSPQYNEILSKEIYYSDIDEQYIAAIEFVQQKMREKVDKKGIGIEVNITSNYVISDINQYRNHPLFRFTDKRLINGQNDMLVSINTDDAGIFDTSLYKEYSIIAKTLEVEGYGSSHIYDYIEHLIKLSKKQSWIK